MTDRLTRSDVRSLIAWAVAGIVGLAIAIALFPLAQPEAAIDFRVDSAEAERIARAFFRDRGFATDGWIGVSTLDLDNESQTYLERELGRERANALMAADVPVAAFKVRLFRDQQQEELGARVDPSGRVVGMRRVIPEAKTGARLEREDARRIAETFFRAAVAQPERYALLAAESSAIERPQRRDWTFTWERVDLRAGAAPYRATVTIQGDAIGGLEQGLRVPDAWKREFARLRSENYLYGFAATLAYVLLVVAAVVLLVQHARRGALRWRSLVIVTLGLASIFAALQLNALPLALAQYDTRESYAGFVLRQAVILVAGAVVLALLTAAQWGAGEPLYRSAFPGRLRLWSAWRVSAIRSKEVFRASVIGLALAAAHAGFVVLFYIVGQRIGVWAPQDIRWSDALSAPLPWLYPVGIGILASTNEETAFRLLAIPLLLRLTGSRVVAVVAPAFVWGFLHSTYPVEPGFVRGVEVGVMGVVAGIVFLRFGLLATLIWHYTFDAGLIGFVLARYGHASFQLSALVVAVAVLAPIGVVSALYVARRSFVVDRSLTNAADPLPPPPLRPAVVAAVARYEPATRRVVTAMLAAGLGGALLYAVIRPPIIGGSIRVGITADDALARGDDILRARGVDPGAYQRVATFGGYPSERPLFPTGTRPPDDLPSAGPPFDALVNEYLRREIGVKGADALYATDVPSVFWRVRYFRELDRREHTVLLRPDGAPFAVWRRLEEAAPGASVTEADAAAIAQRFLRDEQRLDVARWRVVETALQKRPARTDARVVLERTDAIGDAHVRAEVRVADGAVSAYRVFVKIPEDWERRERAQGFGAIASGIGKALVVAALVAVAAVLFFRRLPGARIPWPALGVASAVAVATFPLSAANGVRDTLAAYTTDLPLGTYAGLVAFGNLASVVILFGVLFVLAGAAWMFASEAFGPDRVRPALSRGYWRDALLLGLGAAGIYLGVGRVAVALDLVWPTDRSGTPGSFPGGVDLLIPAGQSLGALTIAVAIVAVLGVVAGIAARHLRPRLLVPFAIAAAVVLGWQPDPFASTVKSIAIAALTLAAAYVVVTRGVRWNVAAYVIALATGPLLGSAIGLALQPNAWYAANAALAAVALVALYAVPFVLWRRAASLPAAPSVVEMSDPVRRSSEESAV